jgi:hypothetical protein
MAGERSDSCPRLLPRALSLGDNHTNRGLYETQNTHHTKIRVHAVSANYKIERYHIPYSQKIWQECLCYHRCNCVVVLLVQLGRQWSILYSRKYWRELNLAVEPKIAITRILADLSLAVRYGIAIRIYVSRKFGEFSFGGCNIDRQTTKFNRLSKQRCLQRLNPKTIHHCSISSLVNTGSFDPLPPNTQACMHT